MSSALYIIFYVTLGFFLCLCGVLFLKLHKDALENVHNLNSAIEKIQSYLDCIEYSPMLSEALVLLAKIKIDY